MLIHTSAQLISDRSYDVVVCGAGSSGSVVAGRLAQETSASVLLIESGPVNDQESVIDPYKWLYNLGSDSTWNFTTDPEPGLGGRSIGYQMGRGLGGGGSVNASTWARGHQADWDSYARSTGDEAWDYDHVLDVYRRIENYQGAPDSRRGTDGPMWIDQPSDLHPLFSAFLNGAECVDLPRFSSPNGALMEADAGAALRDQIINHGVRQSPYASYTAPALDSGNLTILHSTNVIDLVIDGSHITGVRLEDGTIVHARSEVVLSQGAINTPRTLMLSGIGDERHLQNCGIRVRQHTPAVGQNLHDHAMVSLIWQGLPGPELPVAGTSDVALMWNLSPASADPPVVVYVNSSAFASRVVQERIALPDRAVSMLVGVQMHGRGSVALDPSDVTRQPRIHAGYLAGDNDIQAITRTVERCRDLANSAPLKPFLGAEVFPAGSSTLVEDIRAQTETFWHQSGTARMGAGSDAVVDSRLRVMGFEGLRVADSSVLPHVTVANTMAPSVVVGNLATDFIIQGLNA